uniref:Adenylyl cyclase-associated protein n=1 Tax=Blastobotrys adeninivorans TaxID=409370 RepID=A0A060T3I9_BLAAD
MTDKNSVAGYNIVTLMKRLEAATSRLEDLTVFQAETLKKAGKSVTIDSDDKTIEDKEEDVTMKDAPAMDGESTAAAGTGAAVGGGAAASAVAGAGTAVAAGSGSSDASTPAFVAAFKSFIDELVDPFLSMSKAIGPLVEEQVVHLAKGFENELKFIEVASKSQNPKVDLSNPPPAFMDLFSPISKQGEVISSVRESNRGSNFINHLATVAEGTPALGWVIMDDPVQYITDFKDSAQFYANKVMKEFKETDKKQVEWAQQFIKILNGLLTYVKQYHQKGLSWNANGQPFDQVAAAAGGASPSTAAPAPPAPGPGGPPPPPPPMPPASVFKSEDDSSKGSSSTGGMSAVFSEINKGESVTSGLRKVDKSEMTHKNPELRRQAPESSAAATSAKPAPPKKPAALSNKKPKKPARKELVDTKWIVENYENAHDIVIEVEMNQGVFIDRCTNCTIQLKGKANAVSINECSKVGVLVDNLVAGVDVIKCSGFGIQITGKVPTVTIDQSNDGQLYLSSASVDAEIYTAQTSGLNINIPRDEAQGDYKEVPVPEQMVHRVVNGNLVTEIVEHAD